MKKKKSKDKFETNLNYTKFTKKKKLRITTQIYLVNRTQK